MSISTLSFLLVHDKYQDSISYDIKPEFTFEQVIDHICSAFNFNRKLIEIRSNLGIKIDYLTYSVEEIMNYYGTYFKIIVHTSISEKSQDTHEPKSSVETQVHNTEVSYSRQRNNVNNVAILDVFDDLMMINYENWQIDGEGKIEITIVPKLNSNVTQLRIKPHSESRLSSLMSEISSMFRINQNEVLLTNMDEQAMIIDDMDMNILEMVETYGALFILYPIEKKEQIITQSDNLSKEIKELIFKYKRRE